MRPIDELVEKLHSLTAEELLSNKAALHWIAYGASAFRCEHCSKYLGRDTVAFITEDGTAAHCTKESRCEDECLNYMIKEKEDK